jgi:hypothetical protein
MGFSVIPEPAISGFTGPQGPAGTIPSDPVFTGSMAVNDTSGDPNIDIKKNGSMRWKIRSAGTESGSNNGSDLWVEAFADDGTTKINDPIWISRTTGQVAIGIADSSQGGVKLSVNGAIGTRDITADPPTTSMGAQLYSKAGKLWVQTASGAEKFQVVESLPSKANATLSATYMSIDKSAGNYRVFRWLTDGASRWEAQVDDVAEAGSAVGSDFRLSARNDDGSFNKTVIHARRSDGTITFGTTTHHGSAQVTSAGAVGLRDIAADPATATGGAFLYSKSGVAYVKQGDGTVFQLGAGGGGGAVSSVNGKTGVVALAASDVNALPTDANGTTTGVVTAKGFVVNSADINQNPIVTDSPSGQAARLQVMRVNGVDKFSLTATGALTLGGALTSVGTSQVDNLRIGASASFGGASGSVLAMANATTVPTTTPSGAVLYVEGGVLKVKQADGATVVVQNPPAAPVTSVNTKTGAVSLTAADVSAIPTSQKAAASGVASLDSTTRLPIAQIPAAVAKNEWTPQSVGFQAWSVDPGTLATPTTGRSITIGRTYLAGFNITEPTTVSELFVFAAGWAGSTAVPAARFWAGIYNESGSRVATSGTAGLSNVGPAGQESGAPTVQASSHAGAVPFPLTGSVTLQPGRYWGAFQMSAGVSTDFYYFYAQNEAATNTSVFHNLSTAFIRNAYLNSITMGTTGMPTTITKANFQLNHDQMVMAIA